jgi:hypothetical protein
MKLMWYQREQCEIFQATKMNKQIYTVNDPFFVQGPIFDQQVDLKAFLPHPSNNFITFYSHF